LDAVVSEPGNQELLKQLTTALTAYLNDANGKMGQGRETPEPEEPDEEDDDMGEKCEACGADYGSHALRQDHGERECGPADGLPKGVLSRGRSADFGSANTTYTSELEGADDNPNSATTKSPAEQAAIDDQFKLYDDSSGDAARLGIGLLTARKAAAERDGFARYKPTAAKAAAQRQESRAAWARLTRQPAPTNWGEFFQVDSGNPHAPLRIWRG
jgi:hypothetical protein